jgi:ABC-type sugar transport system substrate-binding protein
MAIALGERAYANTWERRAIRAATFLQPWFVASIALRGGYRYVGVGRKSMKITSALAGLALAALAFAAHAQSKPVIAFSVSGTTNPFYASMVQGVRQEAAKQGFELIVLDAQDKAEKQASDIEDARSRGIKALLINPVNASIAPVIRGVLDANIPV